LRDSAAGLHRVEHKALQTKKSTAFRGVQAVTQVALKLKSAGWCHTKILGRFAPSLEARTHGKNEIQICRRLARARARRAMCFGRAISSACCLQEALS
jgi:hypothetical protein